VNPDALGQEIRVRSSPGPIGIPADPVPSSMVVIEVRRVFSTADK
jgi:hypothetical protein